MKREAFIRELRAIARKRNLFFEVETELGKGSHYTIRAGNKKTIIKSGEITPLYAKIIKRQLEL